jgi:D-alanyl-D-alanine dipeptidase
VYDEARAFARIPVVLALKSAQKELNKQGLGLKIYDAYRPYSVTVKFFEIAADKNFVASPKTGSRHNRGCAIDLTLVNMRTGKELKMPTPFDSFAPEASPGFNDLPKKVKRNRDLLKHVMERNGFTVLHNEWWHFDFNTWKDYNLMDIPFKQL